MAANNPNIKSVNNGVYGLLMLGLIVHEHLKDGLQLATDSIQIGLDLTAHKAELAAAVAAITKAREDAKQFGRKEYFSLGHMALDVGEGATDVMIDNRPNAEVLAELKARLGL